MNSQPMGLGMLTPDPRPKSVFINQLDGGYTINLQGNKFYPVKAAFTIDEVKTIITDFFNSVESDTNATQTQATNLPQNSGQINEAGVEAPLA